MNSYLKTRMNRQTYWTILLPVVVLLGLAIAFMPRPPGLAELILVALGVPRLHDLGRSGWWMAVPIGLEFVGIGAGMALGGMDGVLIAGGIVVLFMIVVMVVIGLIPGQVETNAYGGPPPPGFGAWRKTDAPSAF